MSEYGMMAASNETTDVSQPTDESAFTALIAASPGAAQITEIVTFPPTVFEDFGLPMTM